MVAKSLLRTDKEIADLYERHKLTVYRVCFAFMKNAADTEDAVQDTFIRLIKKGPAFENGEHEKAWLIRTAGNLCKNSLRHWWRKREDLERYQERLLDKSNYEIDETLSAVLGLPDRYKTAVYLYYYEGYNSGEISSILGRPPSTVRNHLHEARALLKKKLGGDFDEKRKDY